MSLKLVRRHGSTNYYLRGSIRGLRVDESTGLSDRKAAEEVLAIRQAEIVRQAIHGSDAVKTFADAALSYMEAGGDRAHLEPLIRQLGRTKLAQVGQAEIDQVAKKLGKGKMPSTINRQVHTPIAAVLHHAARKKWCSKPVIERPRQPQGRVRYLSHEEAERLIANAAPHLQRLLVFLFSTGARVSEALYLDWADLDLEAGRVVFHETKNGESRGVPLHSRVVEELRKLNHRTGAVFRRPDGEPYADREGAGGGQLKTGWAAALRRAGISNFRPHDCRHTWATWHYRQNRDLIALMQLGGWKSEKMVMRYAHVNMDHLAPTMAGLWGKSGDASQTGEIIPFRSVG